MAISILGNVGNAGFALPMASAYPTDVNASYLLAWDPGQQALTYVPTSLDESGNWTIAGMLTVQGTGGVRTSLVSNPGANLALAGGAIALNASTSISAIVGISIANSIPANAFLTVTSSGGQVKINSANIQIGNTGTPNQVVSTRKGGWSVPTGTATRTTFATGSVTLPQLAEAVKALIEDLHATAGHGLIGV